MRGFFRYVLLGLAWLFLAAIVAQVYFAGLMLFGQEGADLHEACDSLLGTPAVLFVALPALAREGTRAIVFGVVLALITFFQPSLTFARDPWSVVPHNSSASNAPQSNRRPCEPSRSGGEIPNGYEVVEG